MKKTFVVVAVVLAFVLCVSGAFAAGSHMEKHPRIHKAIAALDAAIAELKAAPHDFNGHREAAVDACQKAKEQLKEALEADKH